MFGFGKGKGKGMAGAGAAGAGAVVLSEERAFPAELAALAKAWRQKHCFRGITRRPVRQK